MKIQLNLAICEFENIHQLCITIYNDVRVVGYNNELAAIFVFMNLLITPAIKTTKPSHSGLWGG